MSEQGVEVVEEGAGILSASDRWAATLYCGVFVCLCGALAQCRHTMPLGSAIDAGVPGTDWPARR